MPVTKWQGWLMIIGIWAILGLLAFVVTTNLDAAGNESQANYFRAVSAATLTFAGALGLFAMWDGVTLGVSK